MAATQISSNVAVGVAPANSDDIGIAGQDGARFYVPAGSAIASVVFYDSPDGETYYIANDSTGNSVGFNVAAGRSYTVPPALNAAKFVKIVGNAAGTISVAKKQMGA